jgi:hypothetical protein
LRSRVIHFFKSTEKKISKKHEEESKEVNDEEDLPFDVSLRIHSSFFSLLSIKTARPENSSTCSVSLVNRPQLIRLRQGMNGIGRRAFFSFKRVT